MNGVGLIEPVRADRRAAFEREHGQIKALRDGRASGPAPARARYYVVAEVLSRPGQPRNIDTNVGEEPARHAVLLAAAAVRQATGDPAGAPGRQHAATRPCCTCPCTRRAPALRACLPRGWRTCADSFPAATAMRRWRPTCSKHSRRARRWRCTTGARSCSERAHNTTRRARASPSPGARGHSRSASPRRTCRSLRPC